MGVVSKGRGIIVGQGIHDAINQALITGMLAIACSIRKGDGTAIARQGELLRVVRPRSLSRIDGQ
ncbi:MAG: hypothetical protein K0U36_04605 [Alphaproteobacteria bacterium]|nr:hypothetical protein [Alphaproteobacteria bacterium]